MIGTSSYRLWRPDLGVPVRTSVGPPRFMQAPVVEWPTVYPPWALVRAGLPEADYRRRYRHQLHRLTPKILHELEERQEGYCAPLVLCCHCNLAKGWCHRRMLAEWISQKLGVEVPEVG